jgi:SAM-dependent methyltransferase
MIFSRKRRSESPAVEVSATLDSLSAWEELIGQNPHFRDGTYLRELGERVVASGATEPLTNASIGPGELANTGDLREGLTYKFVNSRMRAVMLCIQWVLADQPWMNAKIYATEAVTAFALRLRGIFPKFIGSEYTESEEQRKELYPILCEDLQELSFPDDSFHVVTTNEVLEHVPSIDGALAEIHRVLQPGGWHVGTAPFAMAQYPSVVKAKLDKGQVVYLSEPEYHGNPVDERGSLVFEVPGWDILDRAKAVGFREAHVKFIMSTQFACLSSDAGGIFVFCFQK